jgi:hypothetical protein
MQLRYNYMCPCLLHSAEYNSYVGINRTATWTYSLDFMALDGHMETSPLSILEHEHSRTCLVRNHHLELAYTVATRGVEICSYFIVEGCSLLDTCNIYHDRKS